MMIARRSIGHSAACLCLILATIMTSRAAAEKASAPRNGSIRRADMRADMLFLTSDSLNGRVNGTRDTDVAAEFIKARLDRMGLKGAGPGGAFFHRFTLMTVSLGPDNRLEIVLGGGPAMRLRPGQDYYPLEVQRQRRGPGSRCLCRIRDPTGRLWIVRQGIHRPRPRSRARRIRSAEPVRRGRPFGGVEPAPQGPPGPGEGGHRHPLRPGRSQPSGPRQFRVVGQGAIGRTIRRPPTGVQPGGLGGKAPYSRGPDLPFSG